MILQSEFTIRVYIVFFVWCQKNIFDNLALHNSKYDPKIKINSKPKTS